VIVYGLVNTPTVSDLQVLLTALRGVLQVQKIYQYSSAKMLAFRADPERVQMAEWLIPKLDTTEPSSGNNQMQFPGGKDDVVKVFYLPKSADLGRLMTTLRSEAGIPVLYQNLTPPALVVRSTADQVEMAGKLIAAR
jgi:hypothetical protein